MKLICRLLWKLFSHSVKIQMTSRMDLKQYVCLFTKATGLSYAAGQQPKPPLGDLWGRSHFLKSGLHSSGDAAVLQFMLKTPPELKQFCKEQWVNFLHDNGGRLSAVNNTEGDTTSYWFSGKSFYVPRKGHKLETFAHNGLSLTLN